MTDPVPSNGTTKEQLSEAAEIANSFIRYAYEQGMHEVGIDPVKILTDEIGRLNSESVPISVLREHWLTGIECDHAAKTDVATCYCSRWRSAIQPNIPAAVDEWIKHLLEQHP